MTAPFPAYPLAANKSNNTPSFDDHPEHHDDIANGMNSLQEQIIHDLVHLIGDETIDGNKSFTLPPSSTAFKATGLTGAVTSTRWVGGTATGAPTTGTFVQSDWVTTGDGRMFICIAGGTPGTWVEAGSGDFAPVLSSPGAMVDIGPALQAAFDAHRVVLLAPNQDFYLDTPVFTDAASNSARYALYCQGSRIQLGSHLPHPTTWVASIGASPPTAFFNGTLRSAWNGVANSAVTTDSTTGCTNATFGSRLVIYEGEFTSDPTTPCQLVFGGTCSNNNNGAAAGLKGCAINEFLAGMSWSGYADENWAEDCEFGSAHSVGGRLFYQRAAGDGSKVKGCKAWDPLSFVVDVSGAHDIHISDCVGGRYIIAQSTFTYTAGHMEATDGSSAAPNSVNFDRAIGSVNEVYTWDSYISTKHSYLISDTAGPSYVGSRITFNRNRPTANYSGAAGDPAMGSTYHIAALNTGGEIIWNDCARSIRRAGGTASLMGIWVTSADSAITAAIALGGDNFANGNAALRYTSGWVVTPSQGTLPDPRVISAPSATLAVDGVISGGTLTNGQTYEYIWACYTAAGGYSPVSAAVSLAANANKVMTMIITNPSGPCQIAVWRKTGTGVAATPDHFALVGLPANQTLWIDTGANINGIPWQTSSVPVPNTVAGTGPQRLSYSRQSILVTPNKTSAVSAQPGDELPLDTTGGTFPLALPVAPPDGSEVIGKWIAGTVAPTATTGGSDVFNLAGGATSIPFAVLNEVFTFRYRTAGAVWIIETSMSRGGLDTLYTTPAELAGLAPTNAFAETYPRVLTASASGAVLSTGRLSLAAIHLHAGQVVTNIGFLSAAQALVGGSNQWFALFSSTFALLGVTSDDGATAWGTNAAKVLSLTSAYTVPTTGLYYLGINVTATTPPSLRSYTGSSAANGISPKLEGTSTTGLTNPASAPNPATSPTATGVSPYAWVT